MLFFLWGKIFAQESPFKVFLIGDAGDKKITGETLDSLKSQLIANPNSAVVFLGDNSYRGALWGIFPTGFRGYDGSKDTKSKIKSQLNILNDYKGSIYFVPGNHDWWNSTNFDKGKRKLKLEEDFIQENLKKNKNILNASWPSFLPSNGNPGPVSVELNNKKLRLVFVDTYWFILLGFKNTPYQNEIIAARFYHDLDSILDEATMKKQKIIVAAHHPVNSVGSHAYEVKHPKFLSRFKTSSRNFPSYERMALRIDTLLKKYPGTFYASGHVHALQYYLSNRIHYIISGSGSKIRKVKQNKTTDPCTKTECRVWNEQGFFEIHFFDTYEKIYMTRGSGKKKFDIEKAPEHATSN